ncbi:MAG: TolC family protein [Balneolaceae bacterium]|nr:TolC family protein [Balneolaceae bacterium]
MNKHLYLLLLLGLFIGGFSSQSKAQSSVLTLESSIEYAKQNSPLSRAARFAVLSAKWRYSSFRADLYPSLSLNGDAPNYNKSIFSNVLDDGTVTFSSRTQSEASAALSIDQNIMPTGGRLSLSSGITRLGIFTGENTYLWQSTPLVASINQPLFQFNSLKWQNKTEPLRFKIAKKQYVEDMEELATTVTESYFDLLLARINVEAAEFNVTVNDSIFNISQGRFQVGSIAENELLQSELEFRNARASLTTARLGYERAIENFKALLGLDDDQEIEITVPAVAEVFDVDVDKAQRLATENNSTSLLFDLNRILADQAYDQAVKNTGFSANLRASYGLNQSSPEISELYEDPENRQFFTVGFQIPIFNWGKNRAEIKSARNQQQETANTIAYQKLQFELSVKSTVREFLQLRDQVELARISNDIAARRYDVAKNRYLIGKIDITNLFIAQSEKDGATRNYIQSLRRYWQGYYNLRQLTLYDFEADMPIEYEQEF